MDNQLIADICMTGIEVGIGYWATDVHMVPPRQLFDDLSYVGDFVIHGRDAEDPDVIWSFTKAEIWAEIRARGLFEDHDAEDADAVIQLAAFGEIVYG